MLGRFGRFVPAGARRAPAASRASRASRRGVHLRTKATERMPLTLVGAPLSSGQPLAGADLGPHMLRQAGLVEKLGELRVEVNDIGELDFVNLQFDAAEDDPMARNSQAVGAANRLLSDTVAREAADEKFVLTVGGDHSIGIGTVSGVLRANPDASVVWVDAHADLNTPESSASKNIHGMALAFSVERMMEAAKVRGFEWMDGLPQLPESRAVFIGLRDLDPFEKEFLRRSGARAFTMQDIDQHGIGKVMEMTLEHLHRVNRGGRVHLSVDIDVVDPFLAPSTGTVVRGGLTFRESNYVCEALGESGSLSSMDLVEVNPTLDPAGAQNTSQMAIQMICSALGQRIL